MIDLRSDTVTKPTPAMRRAIAEAEVGDDVFGDDPTVQALERATAEILGKEAALFVPSGTMANQLAVRVHTRIGDELLMEAGSHVYGKESGAAAALSGVTCRPIPGRRGIFSAADVIDQLRPVDVHHSPERLLWIENTHNAGGGTVWPIETVVGVSKIAHDRDMVLHMDGARLWNAAIASGVTEREYARHCDTVSVCFSKGLGAPVGSAVAGTEKFIFTARRVRKQFGGGMRQSGLLAAGALYALKHHRERLAEDHANARLLADGVATIPGAEILGGPVETNIVRFRIEGCDAPKVEAALLGRGIAILAMGADSFRVVTSLMVTTEDMHTTLRALQEVLAQEFQPA